MATHAMADPRSAREKKTHFFLSLLVISFNVGARLRASVEKRGKIK